VPRRTRCGVCGDALWVYPTPSRTLKHVAEIKGQKTYDHDAVWPAPSEREQQRIQEEKDAEYSPFVHRGQHGPECPDCAAFNEDVDLRVLGLRTQAKDPFISEEAV
jgi:hypothetical protein